MKMKRGKKAQEYEFNRLLPTSNVRPVENSSYRQQQRKHQLNVYVLFDGVPGHKELKSYW